MSEFFGVSSGFVSIVIATIVITLFCYILYMVYYHISSYAVKRELFGLGDKYREYLRVFTVVSLFMSVLTRTHASFSLMHRVSICVWCISIALLAMDGIAYMCGFYRN